MKKELLSLIRTVAPTMATALGGPFAGMATKAISTALLGAPDGDIEAALLGATPETMLKLKEAEGNFAVELKKLEVDLEAIHGKDRDSARKMRMVLKDKLPAFIAIVIIGGFFGTVWYVLSGKVGLEGKDAVLIGTVVGYVSAKAEQVVSYYFGSSKGSADKNKLLTGISK